MSFRKIILHVLTALKYLSLVFFSFVAILPIISCVVTAFKTDAEYQSTNVMTMPESWLYFKNFVYAFENAHMGKAFINSGLCADSVYAGGYTACLCAEPFQVSGQ